VTVSRPRAETAPLFGETKGETKLFTWVVLGLLGVAALEAITVALVYAVMDKNFDHVSLVLTVLVAAIVATVLYRWHTNGGECGCVVAVCVNRPRHSALGLFFDEAHAGSFLGSRCWQISTPSCSTS
jgi:hypothetical protein